MADNLRQSADPYDPVRVRREELIRPADKRRTFTEREAQRRLQQKERPRWALIAYAVFLAAILIIFSIAYTTYAFSKYRGEILPGVHVDQLSLSGLTHTQATNQLTYQLLTIYKHPVRLVFGSLPPWLPSAKDIGYEPNAKATISAAERVGRHETFIEQLLDRMPLRPDHSVPLVYSVNDSALRAYIQGIPSGTNGVNHRPVDAGLSIDGTNHVVLRKSSPGHLLDVAGTVATVHAALGALTTQSKALAINYLKPSITDAFALGIRRRVEAFLSHPPVIAVGRRVVVTNRSDFAPTLSFQNQKTKDKALIVIRVNPDVVRGYVSRLASSIDRPAQNARLDFSGGQVSVLATQKLGRTLDETDAQQKLLAVIQGLQPHARLHFKVTTVKPRVDVSNPASLGINTTLATQKTTFAGAPSGRLTDVAAIAASLDNVLIQPNQEISFNSLVGQNWSSGVYSEQERSVQGTLVPGRGGAMQQVATTFLRALYTTGLKIEERHAHVHRFSWYEPPAGLDAIAYPATNQDLRFRNNTGKYLLIKTRVEPVRQEVYVYVYGPKLGWKVSISPTAITKQYPHGSAIVRHDSSLSPGETRQIAWAHDGADTDVVRTIEYPNGGVKVDHLISHYQPWRAIIVMGGSSGAKATPGTKSSKNSGVPGATPTPTFNH